MSNVVVYTNTDYITVLWESGINIKFEYLTMAKPPEL